MAEYMIKFDIPDNDTVIKELPHTFIKWSVWGYSGLSLPIPAADVRENVRGEWIDSYEGHKCSVCGFWIDDEVFSYLTKPIIDDGFYFCPNCGADMRGDLDND